LPTNPYLGPHYENLLPQPLWDLALWIPPDRWISIRHSMVFTAMRVEEAKTVTNGILFQVEPDRSTGDPWAMATHSTSG
jgi:hypothetical protein